jgi:hypothetical protein
LTIYFSGAIKRASPYLLCPLKNGMVRASRNAVLKKALGSGGEKQIKKLYSIGWLNLVLM